ncbi:unnamed protein product [Coregonus sp. 'balchen']|nr:unnamed protein product [Coregonus sp. 'balchen']
MAVESSPGREKRGRRMDMEGARAEEGGSSPGRGLDIMGERERGGLWAWVFGPIKCERAALMTKWLKNIWPANQAAEYTKETAIQRAQLTRQNGAKTVEIVREYPRLLDTPGIVG